MRAVHSVLLGGTLCDARVFDGLAGRLAEPDILDFSDHDDASHAAVALLPRVPSGSLGIAFSLGGWVLLEMARLAPERFTGLVLLSANAHPDDPANRPARLARVEHGRGTGLRALIEADWPGSPETRDVVAEMAEACGHDVHHRQALLNAGRPDHRPTLAALDLPVLVIAGADDALCPAQRYADMATAGAELHTLSGVGHYVPLEEPGAVVDLIAAGWPEAIA